MMCRCLCGVTRAMLGDLELPKIYAELELVFDGDDDLVLIKCVVDVLCAIGT